MSSKEQQWIHPQAKAVIQKYAQNEIRSYLYDSEQKELGDRKNRLDFAYKIYKILDAMMEDAYNTHNSSHPNHTRRYANHIKQTIGAELEGKDTHDARPITKHDRDLLLKYVPEGTTMRNIVLSALYEGLENVKDGLMVAGIVAMDAEKSQKLQPSGSHSPNMENALKQFDREKGLSTGKEGDNPLYGKGKSKGTNLPPR